VSVRHRHSAIYLSPVPLVTDYSGSAQLCYQRQTCIGERKWSIVVRATGGEKTKYDGIVGEQKKVLCTHMCMCVNKIRSIKGEVKVYSVSFRLRGPVMLDVCR
jgi:hypothetical protein